MEDTPKNLIPIFVMGKRYMVPESLTIQKAMEYAGYQLIRGCGCRGGICGACGTVYRKPDSYRIEIGLACQTVVEPDMYLTQIPFFPANKAVYDIEKIKASGAEVARLYPEIFKCIGCNTCARSCPMDIDVMDYISEAIRGNIKRVAELSFDCVMCGLCSARCPAEEVQYHVAELCRRLNGKYLTPKAGHLADMVADVNGGKYEDRLREIMKKGKKEVIKIYEEREIEPDLSEEDWVPKDIA